MLEVIIRLARNCLREHWIRFGGFWWVDLLLVVFILGPKSVERLVVFSIQFRLEMGEKCLRRSNRGQNRPQLTSTPGQLLLSSRLPNLPLLRWRNRLRLRLSPPRTPLHRLRQKMQTRIRRLPRSPRVHRRRRALQRRTLHAFHNREL